MPRNGDLRGLGGAVVDHLGRHEERRLAADEHDPAPSAAAHSGHVVAGEPDTGEHVDLEVPQPVGVGDLEHRRGLEDAGVVHQDVGARDRVDQCLGVLGARQVGRDGLDPLAPRHAMLLTGETPDA
jgi:hypothetical protein